MVLMSNERNLAKTSRKREFKKIKRTKLKLPYFHWSAQLASAAFAAFRRDPACFAKSQMAAERSAPEEFGAAMMKASAAN